MVLPLDVSSLLLHIRLQIIVGSLFRASFNFHEDRGAYQDIEGDEELIAIARDIAVSLGHDQNPVNARSALQNMGFEIMGAGNGGLSYYRKKCEDAQQFLTLCHSVRPKHSK